MNRKGFTLIELLSSIAIMGMIATVTTLNIVKIFDNKEKASLEEKNNIITTAACIYIELQENTNLKQACLTNGCYINTNTLIENGLLNEEDVSNYKVIHIYKENNEKKCIMEE